MNLITGKFQSIPTTMIFIILFSVATLYILMTIITLGLWWYCFGERHPKMDMVDSFDEMLDSIKFYESKWQGICGWGWPIFILPLMVVGIVRAFGWRLVRDEE